MKADRSAREVGKAAECVQLDRETVEAAPARTAKPHASFRSYRTSYQALNGAPSLCWCDFTKYVLVFVTCVVGACERAEVRV